MKDLEFYDDGLRLVITDEVVHATRGSVTSIDLFMNGEFLGGMELDANEAARLAEKLLRFARKATA